MAATSCDLLAVWIYNERYYICIQAGDSGLVVVHEHIVLGLHCSSAQLHAGQVAVVKHGPRLKGCDLYFSRKPCSTCLKLLINGKIIFVTFYI